MTNPLRGATRGVAALSLLLTACASPGASPSAEPSPTPPAEGDVIVTFSVVGEEYRIRLTDPDDIAIARRLLAGEEAPRIPNGVVVRDGDGGVNAGYSWHIDPDTLEFAEMTMELCDGRPSDVEAGTISGDRYCPWDATVVAVTVVP